MTAYLHIEETLKYRTIQAQPACRLPCPPACLRRYDRLDILRDAARLSEVGAACTTHLSKKLYEVLSPHLGGYFQDAAGHWPPLVFPRYLGVGARRRLRRRRPRAAAALDAAA